jgi:1,4-alpha-glucan branching enzyme
MARTCGTPKTVEFRLYAPSAKKVRLAGDFNKWSTRNLTAKKDTKGNWMIKASLKPGRYEYKFFVDGRWMDDPSCGWRVGNAFGSQNCVIDIK